MTLPYTVTLTQVNPAGWSYSSTQGVAPDPDDVVQLADNWTYSWAWEAGAIPGQMEPSTATVRMLARTADDVPAMDIGDLLAMGVSVETPTTPVSMTPTWTPASGGAPPYVLGSEFTVNTDGYITALRFYRAAASAATTREVGLWLASTGALMDIVNTTETPGVAGWVETPLPSPVAVTAGQTYVVAYDAPDGFVETALDPTMSSPAFTWVQGRYMGGAFTGLVPTNMLPGYYWGADVVLAPDPTPLYLVAKLLRISSITVELVPSDDDDPAPYAAEVTLELVDTLADLRQRLVDGPLGIAAGTYGGISYGYRDYTRTYWQSRLAEVSVLAGCTIGSPDWWAAGTENPPPRTDDGLPYYAGSGLALYNPDTGGWAGKSAAQLVTELLNSHQPGGLTHSLVPYPEYAAAYPSGWEWVAGVAGGTNVGAGVWNEPAPYDPDSDLRYMIVPASTEAGGYVAVTLDADWCEVPAKARRSREHVVNTLRLTGRSWIADPADPLLAYKITDSAIELSDAADVAGHGPSGRDLPTQLYLYRTPNDNPVDQQYPAAGVAGPRFLTVDAARDAGYTYETFTLDSSLITDVSDQVHLLPILAPRWPGEPDGDGFLLRHITITNLDPSIRFGTDTVEGFLRAGTLTVRDGKLLWSLTLTPGAP